MAQEISGNSGVSEGETISVLKDFRTLLRKTLLTGRSVNIDGIGYFYLSAQSKGTDKPEDFRQVILQDCVSVFVRIGIYVLMQEHPLPAPMDWRLKIWIESMMTAPVLLPEEKGKERTLLYN